MEKKYYQLSSKQVLTKLLTTDKGLSPAEPAKRLAKNGPNSRAIHKQTSL